MLSLVKKGWENPRKIFRIVAEMGPVAADVVVYFLEGVSDGKRVRQAILEDFGCHIISGLTFDSDCLSRRGVDEVETAGRNQRLFGDQGHL